MPLSVAAASWAARALETSSASETVFRPVERAALGAGEDEEALDEAVSLVEALADFADDHGRVL